MLPQVMFEDGPQVHRSVRWALSPPWRQLASCLDEGNPLSFTSSRRRGRGDPPKDIVASMPLARFAETGLPSPERFGWTGVFADEICAQAATRTDIWDYRRDDAAGGLGP